MIVSAAACLALSLMPWASMAHASLASEEGRSVFGLGSATPMPMNAEPCPVQALSDLLDAAKWRERHGLESRINIPAVEAVLNGHTLPAEAKNAAVGEGGASPTCNDDIEWKIWMHRYQLGLIDLPLAVDGLIRHLSLRELQVLRGPDFSGGVLALKPVHEAGD